MHSQLTSDRAAHYRLTGAEALHAAHSGNHYWRPLFYRGPTRCFNVWRVGSPLPDWG